MPAWAKWAVALLVGLAVIVVGFRWAGWLLTAFFVVNCFVLMIVVLLQSGKAADLAGAFGGAGSQTAFGPRGASTFLTKATTWCAIVFMMSSLALSLKRAPTTAEGSSIIEQTMPSTPTKAAPSPAAPSKAPAQAPAKTPTPQPPHK